MRTLLVLLTLSFATACDNGVDKEPDAASDDTSATTSEDDTGGATYDTT